MAVRKPQECGNNEVINRQTKRFAVAPGILDRNSYLCTMTCIESAEQA